MEARSKISEEKSTAVPEWMRKRGLEARSARNRERASVVGMMDEEEASGRGREEPEGVQVESAEQGETESGSPPEG